MHWKTTVLLLAVTVGIGAYISLYELRQPTVEEQRQLAKQIVRIEPASVSQIALDMPDGEVTLTRRGAGWMVGPQGLRANDGQVEHLLRQLNPLLAERALRQPLDPKAFGLDPALGWVTVVSDRGPLTLLLGSPTPIQSNRYLQVSGRPDIFIVSSGLFQAANHGPEAFRDPFLARLDMWQVGGLIVASSSGAYAARRLDRAWTLTFPVADLADEGELQARLNALSALQIKRYASDAPSSEGASTWGFDAPKAELSVRLIEAPSPSIDLVVGNPLPEEPSLLYVRRRDEPSVYAIAAAELAPLLDEPQALRSKAVLSFAPASVARVALARGGTSWTLERVDDRWRDTNTGTTLETAQVEGWLSRLAALRVVRFLESEADRPRYGLDPGGTPERLTVWRTDQAEPERLLIGFPADGSGNRYGLLEGRSAAVVLPAVVSELLAATPEQLRQSQGAQAEAPPAE